MVDRNALRFNALDDLACAKGRGLDKRTVNFLRLRRKRHADQNAREVRVIEHRAVAVPPVESEQTVFAGLELCRAAVHDGKGTCVFLRRFVEAVGWG